MKGIAIAAAGLLIASFACLGTPRAQPAVPEKAPKLTLSGVEAQVVTLQAQVATLQTTLNALHPNDFAVVNSAGALVRGSSSAVSASLIDPGQYQVNFNKNVSGCAYVATIGDTDSGNATPGEVWVATRAGNDDAVFVVTTNSSGEDSERPFHLSVLCP